jgi:hypothetical protein
MNRSKMLAATLFACLPLLAHAESGWYLGLDAGSSKADAEIQEYVLFGGTTAEDSGRSSGYTLRGGYRFWRFFALEVGYADFGDFEYSFDPDDCPRGDPGPCPFSVSTSFSGFTASMVGTVPLGDRWSVHARVGMFEMKATSRQLAGGDIQDSNKEAGLQFGVGAGLKLDEHWQFLLDYSTYEQLDLGFGYNASGEFGTYDLGDTTFTSIGINYRW